LAEFEVIPSVDVLGGKAVRLEQGRFDRITAHRDPVRLVRTFGAAGAKTIHLVDLDAARTGHMRVDVVARLAREATPARVQASGGVRSPADAERLLRAGAARVVVGTAAFAGQRALEPFVEMLAEKLVVAIDCRGGSVVVSGWTRAAPFGPEEAAARCAEAGVARLLCTAVERDGTLAGPDLELMRRVREASGLAVLASGGIRSRSDLAAVSDTGCEGAVVGRAYLEGLLPLSLVGSFARSALDRDDESPRDRSGDTAAEAAALDEHRER
jgi:phosphoribosylformimino-5-aminoimidazole carboxamide ribotide isomerase